MLTVEDKSREHQQQRWETDLYNLEIDNEKQEWTMVVEVEVILVQ